MSSVSVTIKQLSYADDHLWKAARDEPKYMGIGGPTYEMSVMFKAPVFYVRHQVDRFFYEEMRDAPHGANLNEILVKKMTDQLVSHLRGEIEAEIKRQVLANRPVRPEDYAHIIKQG